MTMASADERSSVMLHAPAEWKVRRLGSFATKVGSGATPRGGSSVYLTSRVSHALIRSQHVFDRQFDGNEIAFISEEHSQELRNAAVHPGDILLNITGDGVTFARACIVPDGILPACVNQHVSIVRVDCNICAPGYLLAFLTHPITKRYIESFNTGGSRRAITKGHIESFEVPLPPLPVQQRIAGILSAYDELIENSQRRIRILEAMARALYCEWFIHFRFPGHEKLPRVASPLGDIPQGWEVKPLESLMADHIGGGWGKEAADEEHTEPAWVIRGTDIPDARCCRVANVPYRFHTLANLRSRCLQAGDILFEVSGGSKGQPVGRTLLVTPQLLAALGDDSVICASFCKRVRPDATGYGSELLYLSFLEGYESGEIEQFQVQSTGISNFKWTEYIAKTERVIPPEPLRVRFCERVTPLFSQIVTLGLQIQNLRRTRDLLLPRLLSGQVNLTEN
jgi:type I restriction enzyme, S subunit